MALPLARGGGATRVEVDGELISKPYVEITLEPDARASASTVARDGWRALRRPGRRALRAPGHVCVEGDASSASYFLAAGAIGGGPVRVEGVGRDSIQGDVALRRRARAHGRATSRCGAGLDRGARAARPLAGGRPRLQPHSRRGDDARGDGAVRRRADARCATSRSWRVKETDRIAAMATELRKLGATVDEGADFLDDHAARARSRAGARSTPTTTTAWRCASRSPRSGGRAGAHQRSAAASPRPFPTTSSAFAGWSRAEPAASRSSPSTARRPRARARVASARGARARLPLPRQRRALPAGRAGGAARGDAAGRRAALAALAATLDVALRGRQDPARRRRRHRGASATRTVGARPPGSRRCPRCARRCSTRQRAFRRPPGLVADGRDMGTVVFPDADAQGLPDRERRRRAPSAAISS